MHDLIKTRRSCLSHVCLYAPVQRIPQPSNNARKEKDRQERVLQSSVLLSGCQISRLLKTPPEDTYDNTSKYIGQALLGGNMQISETQHSDLQSCSPLIPIPGSTR